MRKTLLLVVATFVLVACDETSWGKSRAHKASEAGLPDREIGGNRSTDGCSKSATRKQRS